MIDNDATFAASVAPDLPSDTGRMIARWRALGCPYIELDAGVVISNLERWLYNNAPALRGLAGAGKGISLHRHLWRRFNGGMTGR